MQYAQHNMCNMYNMLQELTYKEYKRQLLLITCQLLFFIELLQNLCNTYQHTKNMYSPIEKYSAATINRL